MLKEAEGKWPEIEIDDEASTVLPPSKKTKESCSIILHEGDRRRSRNHRVCRRRCNCWPATAAAKSNRVIIQQQIGQQTPQGQLQQGIPTSQPHRQQPRSSHLPEQSTAHQTSSQQAKQRFHLTPQAKVAVREAVLSAIRHPNGIIDPSRLQRAIAEGFPEKAILNAAVVAREWGMRQT